MPTLHEVQQALQRCMEAEPPANLALSPDASQLATAFAEMRYAKVDACERESLTVEKLAAYDRWAAAGR